MVRKGLVKKTALHKNAWREIMDSKARFLSILGIIFLGVAFFSGIKATGPDMLQTANHYYQENNYRDIDVVGTLGFTHTDLTLLQEQKSIAEAELYRFLDTEIQDSSDLMRIYSYNTENPSNLDNIVVTKGELPKNANEILLDNNLQDEKKYKIGSKLTIVNDTLKEKTFKVVGFGQIPTYIEHISRGNTNVGKGSIDFFGYISQNNFKGDIYEGLKLKIKGDYPNSYGSAYVKKVTQLENQLKTDFDKRKDTRLQEIKVVAEKDLEKAKQELKTAQEKLANGEKELAAAKEKLATGKKELADQKKAFEEKITTSEKELQGQEKKLTEEKNQLPEKKQALEKKEAELQAAEEKLTAEELQLNQGKATFENQSQELLLQLQQLTTLETSLKASNEKYQSLLTLPENQQTPALIAFSKELLAGLPEKSDQWQSLASLRETLVLLRNGDNTPELKALGTKNLQSFTQEVTAKKATIQEQTKKAETELKENTEKLEAAKKEIAEGKKQLETGKTQLESGEKEITEGLKKVAEGKKTLASEKEKALATFKTEEEKLTTGEKEYQKNEATFEKEKKENQEKLISGQVTLDKESQALADLKAPEYLFSKRSDALGYSEYEDNTKRIENIATVFPVIFFLIAALVCFTTMTRMVEEKRGEIGTLKALGYKNSEIAEKYVLYAGLSGIIGCLLGLVVGNFMFPKIIFDAYGSLYNIPQLQLQWHPQDISIAFIIALLCTLVTSLVVLWLELKEVPANLMRPKAPKAGKRLLLERWKAVWRRLSFTHKVTARNIFRYKARGAMTILGIAGCMALMLTGFGLRDSVGDIVKLQFNQLWHYQGVVTFQDGTNPNTLTNYQKKLDGIKPLEDRLLVENKLLEKKEAGVNKQEIRLMVPENPHQLGDFIVLRNRQTRKIQELPEDGVFVSEKFANLFHLKVNDDFTLKDAKGTSYTFRLSGIVENYTMHYLYLSPTYYEKVFKEKPQYNGELLQFKKVTKKQEIQYAKELMEEKAILNVSFLSQTSKMMDDTMHSLNIVIWVLIISAALLAFIVLYNLTNINVSERIRELSTIKVLGFYDNEVTMYIYRENLLLTIIGILGGSLLGVVLHKYVLATVEVDLMMFGPNIHWLSYLYSGILTLAFTILVMIFMHWKLKKIDMIEALKANE